MYVQGLPTLGGRDFGVQSGFCPVSWGMVLGVQHFRNGVAFGECSLGYCVWVYSVSGIQCLQGAMRWVECLEAQYFWYCACRHGALVRVPWVWCAGFAFGVEPCLRDNAYMMYIFVDCRISGWMTTKPMRVPNLWRFLTPRPRFRRPRPTAASR